MNWRPSWSVLAERPLRAALVVWDHRAHAELAAKLTFARRCCVARSGSSTCTRIRVEAPLFTLTAATLPA